MVCSVTGVVNTWAAIVVSFGTEEDSPRALLDSPEAPSLKPDRLARASFNSFRGSAFKRKPEPIHSFQAWSRP